MTIHLAVNDMVMYTSMLVLLVLILEFVLQGSWKRDIILLDSLVATFICIVLATSGYQQVAVVFVTINSMWLTFYSMYIRERTIKDN